jgi:hypothetical protein
MEPVFYVMAILGCGDAGAQCQQARVEQARYSSIGQCQEAMPAALQRNSDIDYPVVAASCQRRGNLMADKDAEHRRG